MSSRSFRRRNSRRRRRQGAAGGGFPGAEGAPPEGPTPQAAGAGSHGGPGGRPQDRSQGSRAQGGRPQGRGSGGPVPGGRTQQGRSAGGHPPGAAAPEAGVRLEPAVPIELPDCPICGKQVRELASALTHRLSGKPAHFDCIVRELRESNEIAPQEKICYLGGGSFGILEFRAPGGSTRFVIKKRIQYEEKETNQDWKKPLQYPC